MRIWSEVRSQAEVALNYQHKFDSGSLPSGLIANWQMDGFNGSNEVVDVVSGNNLAISHASGTGFITSTPVDALHIDENSANGAHVGYVLPTDADDYNDVVSDGLFLEASDPGIYTSYSSGASIGDWDVITNSVVLAGSVWDITPFNGRSIELGASDGGGITQTIATETGRMYQVVFVESGDWGSYDALDYRVSAAGQSVDFSAEKHSDWSYSNMLWNQRSMTFTADGSSTTLQFESLRTGSAHAVIGDVRVIEIPQAVSTILNNDTTLSYDAATDKFYRVVNSQQYFSSALSLATGSTLNGVTGELLTIKSDYENELARSWVQETEEDIWLGMTDTASVGDWVEYQGSTADGDTVISSGAAVTGQYSNIGGMTGTSGEDHARIVSNGGWFDTDGTANQNIYVVQWDASEVLSNYTFNMTDDAGGRFAVDSSTGELLLPTARCWTTNQTPHTV